MCFETLETRGPEMNKIMIVEVIKNDSTVFKETGKKIRHFLKLNYDF